MTWSKSGRARQPEDGEVGVEEGHHLGDPVPAQRQLSAQQSCDVAQGFYFSRPVPASDLTAVLRSKALPGGDAAGEVHAATRSTCATVAGNVHLTNSCRIDGSLHAGGRVAMDSTATIGGELVAGGDVTVQSTNAIGGAITAGGTVTVIDGVPVGDLVDAGTIGGPVTPDAQVTPPDLGPAPVVGAKTLAVDQESTWAQWLHDTATAAGAPSWVAGLSTNPGCTMATWTVGTDTVEVDANTRIDATSQTTGCGSISLHALTLELSGDLTIIADGVASTNGMHVVSADGLPHTLRLLVPGQINDGTSGQAVSLLGGTTTDETITIEIGTPGLVNLSGGVVMRGQIAAGVVRADGRVELLADYR